MPLFTAWLIKKFVEEMTEPEARSVEAQVADRNMQAMEGAEPGTVRARPPTETSGASPSMVKCGDTTVNCGGYSTYQLQGEFLLRVDTGRVWRYDKDADAFVELRRISTPLGELVESDSIADRLQQLREAIERDVLDIPVKQQDAVRASLRAKYLKPLEEEQKARAAQLKKIEQKHKP